MNKKSNKPVAPVPPDGMELLFYYQCPSCARHIALVSPVTPQMIICDNCGMTFPIVPVDERSLHFIHIMLCRGKAAADPDFL